MEDGHGWTEQLKVQPEYARVAQFLYERNLLDTPRTCPLCRLSPGTPRHTTMDCPVTKPLADALRSILEQHLQKLDERGTISSAARAWQRSLSQQGQAHLLQEPDPVSARQWPLLSAWRWLVHIPSRHAELTSDVAGHSASAVLAEGESDLAHRGVLPMDLGNAILRAGRSLAEYQVAPLDDLAPEQFAHLLHPDQLADELAQASARRIRLKPVLDFTTLLLHGLRAIRYHYATRMSFFISCVKLHMHQPEAVPHPLVPAAGLPQTGSQPGAPLRLGRVSSNNCVGWHLLNKSLSHGSRLS